MSARRGNRLPLALIHARSANIRNTRKALLPPLRLWLRSILASTCGFVTKPPRAVSYPRLVFIHLPPSSAQPWPSCPVACNPLDSICANARVCFVNDITQRKQGGGECAGRFRLARHKEMSRKLHGNFSACRLPLFLLSKLMSQIPNTQSVMYADPGCQPSRNISIPSHPLVFRLRLDLVGLGRSVVTSIVASILKVRRRK